MKESYDSTPAGAPGRLDTALEVLGKQPDYEFIDAIPATREQLLLAHSPELIDDVKFQSNSYYREKLYDVAVLAAGGAIQAGEIAVSGQPSFGLIRPPGHHASRSSHWGFCYFNNISVSLLTLRERGLIESAFILDFDLHEGDGNINILGNDPAFTIHNPHGQGDDAFIADIKRAMDRCPEVDIVVASAGFDQYIDGWGGNVTTKGFERIGRLMHEFALERCRGRRYGLLEGGYNHEDLGINIFAFCEGLKGNL